TREGAIPRLRQDFPEEFENPVDPSVEPTAWVPLRVVVKGRTIQIYVGPVKLPTLEVRKRGAHDRGMIGVWTGNGSGRLREPSHYAHEMTGRLEFRGLVLTNDMTLSGVTRRTGVSEW